MTEVSKRLLHMGVLALICLLPISGWAEASTKAPKMVLGWLESTRLVPSNMRIKTKLDPGAKTSSMQAKNLEYFKKNGETWVRFDFTDTNLDTKKEQTIKLEGPLVREVVIKRHGAKNVTRPVVAMNFCLYHQVYRAEFSLADRGKFNYAILLGRSFLSKVALVDSSEIFLSKPECEGNNFIQDALE